MEPKDKRWNTAARCLSALKQVTTSLLNSCFSFGACLSVWPPFFPSRLLVVSLAEQESVHVATAAVVWTRP